MRKPFYLLIAFYALFAASLFALAMAPGCKSPDDSATTNSPPAAQPDGSPTTQPTTQPATAESKLDQALEGIQKINGTAGQIAQTLNSIGVPYSNDAVIATTVLSGILGLFGVKQTVAKNKATKQANQNALATSALAATVAAHSASLPSGVAAAVLSHAQTVAPGLTIPAAA